MGQMFQQIIQSIAAQEPRVAMLAQQDPQAFVSMLTQVLNQAGAGSALTGGAPTSAGEGPSVPMGTGQAPGMDVPVSAEEKAALEGLQAMFPQIPPLAILQTFKACGSDAAMAANLLFDYDGEIMGA